MDEETGVELTGEAALQTEGESQAEVVETGVETQPEAGADEKAPDANTAWEKRISAIKQKTEQEVRQKLEQEYAEKYKDYDTHKELSSYLQEVNGLDALGLKERIELERLQTRADKENVPPEVLKRIDELEEKSARLEEIEQQQQKEQINNLYWKAADDFVKDKGVTKEELNQLLIDNRMTVDPTDPEDVERKFNMAYKAMKTDKLEKELASAKETAVKEYLQSKTAPRVEGSGAPGVVQEDTSKLSWKELEARMVARIQAANQST